MDPIRDEQLAKFVVNSHCRSHPDYEPNTVSEEEKPEAGAAAADDDDLNHSILNDNGDASRMAQSIDHVKQIDQDLLRKYIAYARAFVRPILHDLDSEKVTTC